MVVVLGLNPVVEVVPPPPAPTMLPLLAGGTRLAVWDGRRGGEVVPSCLLLPLASMSSMTSEAVNRRSDVSATIEGDFSL